MKLDSRRTVLPALVLTALALVLSVGCDRQPTSHEDLDATLWMQTSAEYRAACRQTYRLASEQLKIALADPSWSADLVQHQLLRKLQPSALPLQPAVILDVDETVLDNSPYQARLIRQNSTFDLDSWHAWVNEARAEAVPGVQQFIETARAAGVKVFFVTNREHAVENATRRNLESLGLSDPEMPDRILSKNERDGWSSDKSTRREHVARRHRILLQIGDDLNDFVAVGDKPSADRRRQIAAEHQAQWGHRWFMLPNANYGGWERSLYNWDDRAAHEVKLEYKYNSLDSADDAPEPIIQQRTLW